MSLGGSEYRIKGVSDAGSEVVRKYGGVESRREGRGGVR